MESQLVPPADLEVDADEQDLPRHWTVPSDDQLVRPSSDRSVRCLRHDCDDGAEWRRAIVPVRPAGTAWTAQEQPDHCASRGELRDGNARVQVRLQRLL